MLTYRGTRMSTFQKRYLKYVIKSPLAFYSFLALGMLLFVCMAFMIKLDVIESHSANLSGNTVTLAGTADPVSSTVYLYQDRSEKVYKLTVEKIEHQNGCTIFIIDGIQAAFLPREITIDIVVQRQTLFLRIFAKGGSV